MLALVILTVRGVDWSPLVLASVVAVGLAGIARPEPEVVLLVLRTSGVLLAAAAAFVLVDPMAGSSHATPVGRWVRQWLRVVLALGAALTAWGVAFAVAAGRTRAQLPLPGLAQEALVGATIGLAATAVAVRHGVGKVAAVAGLAAQSVLVGMSAAGPESLSPWPRPDSPQWTSGHRFWLLVLLLSMLILATANLDRSPLWLRAAWPGRFPRWR